MAVIGNPLQVGISGLLTSQRSISTISHNVSNVNTEGYTRQRTEILTNMPTYSGAGYIGTGVYVNNVERIYSEFVTRQVQTNTSESSYQNVLYTYSSRVDNILADPNAGMNPTIQSFFDAAQGVADDPVSVPARQVLLTDATTMENRFHIMYQRFSELQDNSNLEMRAYIQEINSLANEIANLNQAISSSPGLVSGNLPNDLMDARDQTILELSQYVDVQTLQQDNYAVNVYIGNGQTLVSNNTSIQIGVTTNKYDTSKIEVGYPSGGNFINVTSLMSGGKLGALIEFRDNMLEPTINSMGRLAIGIAEEFNAQHKLGMDLNSEIGQDFFAYSTPGIALPDLGNNPLAPAVSFNVQDPSQLTDSNYLLRYNQLSNDFTLVRESDNTVLATAIPNGGVYPPPPGPPTEIDGFQIDIALGGTLNVGDSYLLRPTEAGARTFTTLIDDPAKVAAAAPIRVGSSLDNLGTATISLVSVSDTDPLTSDFTIPSDLAPPLSIIFDPPLVPGTDPTTYSVFNKDTGVLIAGNIVYDPNLGSNVIAETIAAGGAITGGYEVRIEGRALADGVLPIAGDEFTIDFNFNGTSDNRNALAFAGLQTELTMLGGNASFQDAYGNLVSTVGSETHQVDLANKAHESLLRQAIDNRESLSGVNLDEEAADMMRFQQAYNAAAQVIVAANSMMDELLAAVRS